MYNLAFPALTHPLPCLLPPSFLLGSRQDLTNLNRPLSKVVIVDTDPETVRLQPENSIILDKWTGDINDKSLWKLITFLQSKQAFFSVPTAYTV